MHVSSSQVTILQHIHADTGVLRDDIAVARITVPRSYIEHVANSDWELASLRWVPATTVQRMIANGEITDGITLAAWSVYCAQAPPQQSLSVCSDMRSSNRHDYYCVVD